MLPKDYGSCSLTHVEGSLLKKTSMLFSAVLVIHFCVPFLRHTLNSIIKKPGANTTQVDH